MRDTLAFAVHDAEIELGDREADPRIMLTLFRCLTEPLLRFHPVLGNDFPETIRVVQTQQVLRFGAPLFGRPAVIRLPKV